MTIRKLSAILLVSMLFFGATLAQAADYKTTNKTKLTLNVANASTTYDEVYTLSIPDDFTLNGSGWNSVGKITASYGGTNSGFDSSKKLVVTVASENGGLTSTTDSSQKIGYTIKSAESDTAAVTTFEFTADEINKEGGTSKPIGVKVEDYSSKSAGDYEDYIVYTASVATTRTVTWTASDINSDSTVTKDGVTLTANQFIDTNNKNITGGGTFTTASGNFTKIVVTANDTSLIGFDKNYNTIAGWSDNTWTGNASSVQCGTIMGNGQNITIVFTIEE